MNEVPSRTIDPIKVKYVALTQENFEDILDSFASSLNELYDSKHHYEIDIVGYDDSFASTKVLFKELSLDAWSKLDKIVVKFYGKDSSKYIPVARMQFGPDSYGKAYGLRVEILQGTTPQKIGLRDIATKFLVDYTRKVYVSKFALSLIAAALVGVPFFIFGIGAIETSTKIGGFADKSVASAIWGLVTGLVIAGAYSVTGYIYKKFILTNLELLKDKKQTKLSKSWAYFAGLAVVIGLIIPFAIR